MSIKQAIESPAGVPGEYHRIVKIDVVVETFYNEETYKEGKRPVHTDKKSFSNEAQTVLVKEAVPAKYDEDGKQISPKVDAVTEDKKLHDTIVAAAYDKLHKSVFTEGEKI